jgi:Tfp pilus assembly protein PilO
MGKQIQKQLLLILALTIVFGGVSYFIGKLVDETVAEVTHIREEIDEKTRVATDINTKIDEMNAVSEYKDFVEENLPNISDLIEILEQLEVMAKMSDVDLTLQLEEGVVGEGEIEFKDEVEKQQFLKNIEVEEYTPAAQPATTSTDAASTNVALQQQSASTQPESELKINYLLVSASLQGNYDSVRKFIYLTQNSKFFFNIKEIRINKKEEGELDTAMQLRAFIFEK